MNRRTLKYSWYYVTLYAAQEGVFMADGDGVTRRYHHRILELTFAMSKWTELQRIHGKDLKIVIIIEYL